MTRAEGHGRLARLQPDSGYSVEFTSRFEDLEELWPAARQRHGASLYPFQSADLIKLWCSTIGDARGIQPVFTVCRSPDGTPLLLLPLMIERSMGLDVLRFMDCDVIDYNAPVVLAPDETEQIDVRRLWKDIIVALPPFDVAILEKMPDTVEGTPNPLIALATEDHPECGHAVTLTGPWEEFARTRLPNWRDSRRCLRNLQKLGAVSFHIAENETERYDFLETLFRQKRRRFAETEACDVLAEPGVSDFYREATRRTAELGTVLSGLKLDGKLLAVNWGIVAGERYYDLMTGNEGGEYRSYGPGRLLNEWLLSWCLENDVKISDFGIGDEPYKFRYCDVHIQLRSAYIPVTSRGAVYDKLFRAQKVAKRMLRDTKVGTALKAARNRLNRLMPSNSTTNIFPAWIAALGTASIALDA